MNEHLKDEIDMEDAVRAWFENVYKPVIDVIESRRILKSFKGRTRSDLYVFLIKYWDEVKQKYGNDFTLDKAADDFSRQYKTNFFVKFIKNMLAKHRLLKK